MSEMDKGASTSRNLVGSPWTGHGDQSGRPGNMQRMSRAPIVLAVEK